MVNPKNVQQAVKVAVALANPTLTEQDWGNIKQRFQLDDYLLEGVKTLVNQCKDVPSLKTVLSCLTFNS
jgi:hypothetical protein